MDIPGLSMAMAQSRLQTDFGVAMLGKSLDSMQEAGENFTKMMELSVNPDLGANIDVSV